MKRSLSYSLAIAATLALASVACTPTTTTTTTSSTSPSASSTAKPSASPSASPSSSPVASAKPTESSAKPTESKADQGPDLVRVAVINNSGKTLTDVYMSPPSKKDWGPNELTEPLKDREKAEFEWKRSDYKGIEAGCVFEVGVTYNDGAITDLDPIDLCKTPVINLN